MPVYDVRCLGCGRQFEADRTAFVLCGGCGTLAVEWIPRVNISTFKAFWHPHLGHDPVQITSAKQFDQELAARHLAVADAPTPTRPLHLPATEEEARHAR